MMNIGYARTSTIEQVSSVDHREQLNQALDYIRDNDTFVVTRLDRLARSVKDLINIVDTLKVKNANLRS